MDNNKTNLSNTGTKIKFTPLPDDDRTNPYAGKNVEPFNYKQTVLSKTHKGHSMPVTTVVFHPKKPVIGTGSDDTVWKIWSVNQS